MSHIDLLTYSVNYNYGDSIFTYLYLICIYVASCCVTNEIKLICTVTVSCR